MPSKINLFLPLLPSPSSFSHPLSLSSLFLSLSSRLIPFPLFPIPSDFWATVCKTVRPVLSDQLSICLSVRPVCNVGVFWPNVWMDQDAAWYTMLPGSRPRQHCVRWGPSSPTERSTVAPLLRGLWT